MLEEYFLGDLFFWFFFLLFHKSYYKTYTSYLFIISFNFEEMGFPRWRIRHHFKRLHKIELMERNPGSWANSSVRCRVPLERLKSEIIILSSAWETQQMEEERINFKSRFKRTDIKDRWTSLPESRYYLLDKYVRNLFDPGVWFLSNAYNKRSITPIPGRNYENDYQ